MWHRIACLLAATSLPLAVAGVPATGRSAGEPRYLIFWRSPQQAEQLLKTVGTRGVGNRLLGFGLPVSSLEQEQQIPTMVEQCFSTARRLDMAVMFCFDLHTAWQNRPDLWNWFDPAKPGYNPANRLNVEWMG